jgi:hypothetical protein
MARSHHGTPFRTAVALTALVVTAPLVWPLPAAAQATVVVQVRTPDGEPAEGKVTLVPKGEGQRHQCTTREGKCSMEGVPGGSYEVRLEPADGKAPPPRKVMIPPSGKATLIVSTAG